MGETGGGLGLEVFDLFTWPRVSSPIVPPTPRSGTCPSSKSVGSPQDGCRSKSWASTVPRQVGVPGQEVLLPVGTATFASLGHLLFMPDRLGGDRPLLPVPPLQDIPDWSWIRPQSTCL